ncbi:alpha-glucan family phosphorylase [Megalodesulfovibrio paquesii]
MQPLRVFSVAPNLPQPLEPLRELAYNFWFSWNPRIEELFAQLDPRLWRETAKNPVLFLNRVPQNILQSVAVDENYLERLKEAKSSLEQYTTRTTGGVPFPPAEPGQPAVAYFSLEYGFSLSMPIYSGGLGILAGDHLKSASDLNTPLCGIGLFYLKGYFRQYLTPDAWQQERYPVNDFEQMPVRLIKDSFGHPTVVDVDLAGQTLYAQIWKAQVGRIALYLLDTNIPQNPEHLRAVTANLYGGGLEMRLWQEILLGIGGIKALRLLGLTPKVIHMNEGHSAFAGLERIRHYMKREGLSLEAALELSASTSVFTTHTPVPAGNDRFPPDLIQRYFEGYARDMGVAFKVFMALGREDPRDDSEHLCMTVLALKLSRFNNGVSQLHGHVSRSMWQRVWPQYPLEDVPIGAITNGVHAPSWVAPDMALLYDRYLGGNWREDPDCTRAWSLAETISDSELWRTHERLRARLVDFVRLKLRKQMESKGVGRRLLELASEVLDPDALTIGFARRFATYKRAGLLLRDKQRLLSLVTNNSRPVQFVFAGKAHPADQGGKKLIQELVQFCQQEDTRMRMVFLEDYDMDTAAHMVQGVDVWLNTPRRPLEACGTSGMKALVNGVLNLSTLDGWWDEAYKPDNSVGWAIGQGEEYEDDEYQDFVESQTLYNILENDVIPLFYDRDHSRLPKHWVRRMKASLKELVPLYSAHRMVEDYTKLAYIPACENFDKLRQDNYKAASELATWRMDIMTRWSGLQVQNIQTDAPVALRVSDTVTVTCEVLLNNIKAEHLLVEIYSGPLDTDGRFTARHTFPMLPKGQPVNGWQQFEGQAQPEEAGRFGFTVRILPRHPLLLDPHALGLIKWGN